MGKKIADWVRAPAGVRGAVVAAAVGFALSWAVSFVVKALL